MSEGHGQDDSFAERLIRAMEVRHLTNRELAEKVGVQEQQVSKWVNGHVQPRFPELARIVSALEVDARFLIVGDRPIEPVNPSEAETRLAEVQRAVRELQLIAEGKRRDAAKAGRSAVNAATKARARQKRTQEGPGQSDEADRSDEERDRHTRGE